MEKRYNFLDIFTENSDGSLTPKRQIFVNGISFGPGVVFQKGVAFGGIDFHLYKYWDIAVDEKDGVLNIKGFYQQ
ncbi:MAG: hypothetical protein WAV23_01405 [Minisyncoccia bacterium]